MSGNETRQGEPAALRSSDGLGVSADEDLMRVIAKILAERGWFVKVSASRINEHFEVSVIPPVGWGLREVATWTTVCNCPLHQRTTSTGGWYCPIHGQQL